MTDIVGSCGVIGLMRPNRQRGSIRGKSNTSSTLIVRCFSIDILTKTVPSHWTKTCQTLIGLRYCFIQIIFIDADMTYIVDSCAVIQDRPNRQRGSICGKSNTTSTLVVQCFAVNICAHLVPTCWGCSLIRIIFIDAHMTYIIGSCGGVGTTRPNRQRGSIRGKSNSISTLVVHCFAINIPAQHPPNIGV